MFSAYLEAFEFNRTRTLATLDAIAATSDPPALLGWRPGLGRAHVAWQLMHIGVTEEIFAVLGRTQEAGTHEMQIIGMARDARPASIREGGCFPPDAVDHQDRGARTD